MLDDLQQLLTSVALSHDLSDPTFVAARALEKGGNYNSEILKVRVEGRQRAGGRGEMHLVVKRLPRERKEGLLACRTAQFFANELAMHGEVLASMRRFHEAAVQGGSEGFVAIPRLLGSVDSCLALEDMSQEGYRPTDRREGLDHAHCSLVMKELGRLHAMSFALRDQRPEEFRRLASRLRAPGVHGAKEYLRDMAGHAERALLQSFPADSVYVTRFRQCSPGIAAVMADCEAGQAAEPYAVICHGDCWAGNFLFKYAEDGVTPVAVCMLDMQESRYASPVTDIAYFLYCSTEGSTRRQHYQHLMSEYHSSLCAYLRQLGSEPEKLFPISAFQDQERRFSRYGLCWALAMMHMAIAAPEAVRDLEVMLTTSADLGGMWSEQYVRRITDVIVDMVDHGFV